MFPNTSTGSSPLAGAGAVAVVVLVGGGVVEIGLIAVTGGDMAAAAGATMGAMAGTVRLGVAMVLFTTCSKYQAH